MASFIRTTLRSTEWTSGNEEHLMHHPCSWNPSLRKRSQIKKKKSHTIRNMDHFDVDSWRLFSKRRPEVSTPCAVRVLLLCWRVSVSWCWADAASSQCYRGNRRKTCTHMWVLCKGRASALYCFQQMGVTGVRKGVCVCVCVCVCVGVGAAGVCSSSVCQQVNSPPFISDVGQMTGHTPLFTRSRSPYLSDYLFLLSLFHFLSLLLFLTCFKCLSRLLKPLFFFFFFLILNVL